MTPAQLELRRLRELLRAARKARHLVHAMRTPLARLVRFERAAAQVWNRALAKLERVNPDHGFEQAEPDDFRERLAYLDSLTESMAKSEARARRSIEVLSKSKRLTAKVRPIEQRIASRRKAKTKAAERRAMWERNYAQWQADTRVSAEYWLTQDHSERSTRFLREMTQDPNANSAGARAAIRHFGDVAIADSLLAVAKRKPRGPQ